MGSGVSFIIQNVAYMTRFEEHILLCNDYDRSRNKYDYCLDTLCFRSHGDLFLQCVPLSGYALDLGYRKCISYFFRFIQSFICRTDQIIYQFGSVSRAKAHGYMQLGTIVEGDLL